MKRCKALTEIIETPTSVAADRTYFRSRHAACNRIAEKMVADLGVGQALVTGKRKKCPNIKSGRRHVVECKARRYLTHGLALLR
ncbi:hypothetical protein ACFX5Q_31555 [Mesorhizobium sp. IMUNJ 23033]|uniref:hypothetical protein n=1 Tax=Mesorhizobium sp. IMUNJ 23033 TaxID=3378039 RepID=UPI0038505BA3